MKLLLHTLFFFLLLTQICFGQPVTPSASQGGWYPQNSGTTQHLNKVQFVDANTGWAVGDSGTILYTTNAGVTWVQQVSGTHHNLLALCFTSNSKGWAVGGSGEIWAQDSAIILKTTNSGINWTKQLSIEGKFYDVCFTNENNGYVVGYGPDTTGEPDSLSLLLRTTNGGNTWSHQYDRGTTYTSIDFIDDNTGWLVKCFGCGMGGCDFDIYKTNNGGSSWQLFNSEIIDWLYKIKAFDSNFVITVGGVGNRPAGVLFKTTDGGIEWTVYFNDLTSVFKDLCISSENVVTVVGSKMFNGLPIGGRVLRSIDSSNTWAVQEFGSVSSLNGVYFVDDYTGWAVGDSGAILHTTNGGVTFIDNEPTQPTDFLLSQNFPNPFNPTTKITWQSPVGSWQTIKVYDVLGNEIATLVDEYKPAGRYEVEFNAEKLASGIYFYHLKVGDYFQTRKMIFLK